MRTKGRLLGGAAAALLAAGAAAQDAGGLTVFDWSGYDDPNLFSAYIAEHGAPPAFTFFGDEDEAFEKLRAGFRADIGHPCSQSVAKWREAGLLEPLDTSRIAGWDDLNPGIMAMEDLVHDDEGQAWLLPFDWGNTILTYNTARVDEAEVASLRAFADPRFAGRVSLPDNTDDAYALAYLATGVTDWSEATEEDFQAASAFLREVHPNVLFYWTDSTQLNQAMAAGEVDLAWAWNSTATELSAEGLPVAMKRDTAEGVTTWVCGYARLAGAPGSEDLAYDFLSAVNAPEVAAYIVETWGYGHANAAGMAAIDAAVLEATGYDDVAAYVDRTLFQSPLPPEQKLRMVGEFERIKAGF
jgi:spermidine/putrescine transport system substrate-binding protein